MLMTRSLSLLVLFTVLLPTSFALYPEDAGQLDFLVETTGHGPGISGLMVVDGTDEADDDNDIFMTWSETSCWMGARSILNGTVLWRRNFCSGSVANARNKKDEQVPVKVVTAQNNKGVLTFDTSSGALRSWNGMNGELQWEYFVTDATTSTTMWTFTDDTTGTDYVAVSAAGSSIDTILDATMGIVSADNGLTPQAKASRPRDQSKPSQTASCPTSALVVEISNDAKALVWTLGGEQKMLTAHDLGIQTDQDPLTFLHTVSCSTESTRVILSTLRGTTQQVTFVTTNSNDLSWFGGWKAHEGLANIASALLLDSSHYVGDLDRSKELEYLQLSSRLQSQWNRIMSLITSVFSKGDDCCDHHDHDHHDHHHHGALVHDDRSHTFGFVKTAVLLSSSSHSILGMDTVGHRRGTIRYTIPLPMDAAWHKMVHGTPNTASSLHVGGTAHPREVLALSLVPAGSNPRLHWIALDGTTGAVHGSGWMDLSSSIAQVVPMSGTGSLRQAAILWLQDGSLRTVPEGQDIADAIASQIASAPNGFYSHKVDSETSQLQSMLITVTDNGLKGTEVGSVAFPGEDIVRVTYPSREEVVQSPCNVLGDDSLLLKYMNPHLAVIITMSSTTVQDPALSNALQQQGRKLNNKKQKMKPVGKDVAPDASSGQDDREPNLFVNVFDTVSGRILHRSSHTHAASFPTPSAVISENWIFYSFMNERTRRAEIGVLSLYEGMIDNKGLTAFASPEQNTIFSSLDVRESKPVVLGKSYAVSKPVTALGVTSTRNGISTKRLVLASIDGRVYALDRKILEPRRPLGQVKDAEKKEGLAQYGEFIPSVTYLTLSYHLNVENVRGIVTAPTDLESQSLILAYGGPTLFFTRTSPSRGFDLLPDSFNRPLLSVVVVGLIAVTVVVRQRVSAKFQKQGWL